MLGRRQQLSGKPKEGGYAACGSLAPWAFHLAATDRPG